MSLRDATHRIDETAPADRLDRTLRKLVPGASWNALRKLIDTGKVSVGGRVVRDPAAIVTGGDVVAIRMSAPKPRGAPELDPSALRFVDPHLVVVDKPAGVSSVPYSPDELDSLDQLVEAALAKRERRRGAPLGIVHRLDKETSGLMLFSRTLAAQRHLKQQFRFHTIHRRYQALAHGRIDARTLSSRLVRDRGDGLRGSTDNPKLGRAATTHVRPIEALSGATLVECTLETGRTHQIRIHLSEAGHPVIGDRVYVRGYAGAPIAAPRLMLHAASIGFTHPSTGRELRFDSPLPADFRDLLAALRRS